MKRKNVSIHAATGVNLENISQVKEASHKRPHITLIWNVQNGQSIVRKHITAVYGFF